MTESALALPDVRVICGICSRPLDLLDGEWGHARQEYDHIGVPVYAEDLASIDARCDFCMAPAEFTHGCADHKVLTGASLGPFATCAPCHEDILAERYSAMLTRIVDSVIAAISKSGQAVNVDALPELIANTDAVLSAFREHATGAWAAGGYVEAV